jgi:hypothetical protein
LVESLKAEAKTKAQAHVQSIMEEAQLNAKMKPENRYPDHSENWNRTGHRKLSICI